MASPPRRPTSSYDKAEALFKAATTKPVEPVRPPPVLPTGKEAVTLRLDRDVLEHFRDAGAGWQERLNTALRKAAGL